MMTCRAARTVLPLLAGGDLPPRKARRAERHCASCPGCRAELAGLRRAREMMRAASAGDPGRDLGPAAWGLLMDRIARDRAERGPAPASVRGLPALRWAPAAAALVVAIAGGLLVQGLRPNRPPLSIPEGPGFEAPLPVAAAPQILMPGQAPAAGGSYARAFTAGAPRPVAPPAPQDTIVVTFVSQETGLTVNWTFNKNFEWKGGTK